MSRTYNAPPPFFRTKMRELVRALSDVLISMIWLPLKLSVETMLRSQYPEQATRDDRLPQFLGLGSITQDLLDQAERQRRSAIQPDPFDTLVGPAAAGEGQEQAARAPQGRQFHARRHPLDG